jgi:hypothetical protein
VCVCVVSGSGGSVCVLSGGVVCVCESCVSAGGCCVWERGYVCGGDVFVCVGVFVWTCIGVTANNLNEFLFATHATPPPKNNFEFYSCFALRDFARMTSRISVVSVLGALVDLRSVCFGLGFVISGDSCLAALLLLVSRW